MAIQVQPDGRQVSEMIGSPKRSALYSGLLHAGAIVLVLAVTGVQQPSPISSRLVPLVGPVIGRYLSRVPHRTQRGGGGGTRSDTPASKGRLPKPALRQFTPPVAVVLNPNPRLAIVPTIVAPPDIVLPAVDMPQFGNPNGVLGPPSGGRGSGSGIGEGIGTGVGDSTGPGFGPGPGDGGITGQGGIQGSITPPLLLWKIEPEYSEEARRAKIQGTVVLYVEVDTRGQAQNIRVRHSLGLGLDDRAVDAVRRWKFRPGSRNGKPLVTTALVEVNFRLL